MGNAAQGHGVVEHRVEYRRKVAGRRINDLQDLRGRGLPLQRLVTLRFARVTLGSALGKLTFEIGYPLIRIG